MVLLPSFFDLSEKLRSRPVWDRDVAKGGARADGQFAAISQRGIHADLGEASSRIHHCSDAITVQVLNSCCEYRKLFFFRQ
jgi:hypothetical protein